MNVGNAFVAHWLEQNTGLTREQLRDDWDQLKVQQDDDFLAGLLGLGRITIQEYSTFQNQIYSAFQDTQQQQIQAHRAQAKPNGLATSTTQDATSQPVIAVNKAVKPSAANITKLKNSLVSTDAARAPEKQAAYLQRYEIVAEISRGGMGVVYEARDRETDRRVALKLLTAEMPNEVDRKRFEYEARVLHKLDHPNIVQLENQGIQESEPFIAIEYIDGVPLDNFYQNQENTDYLAIIDHFLDLVKAVGYCHDQGVLHRDIKPANILIENESKRLVLLDFGIIRKAETSQLSLTGGLTKEGQTLGTPDFMAPEQIDSDATELSEKTDVWGLAATLYFVLTQKKPFGELDPLQIYKAMLTTKPAPPMNFDAKIPEGLSDLCLQALERDLNRRISLQQFEQQLTQIHSQLKHKKFNFKRLAKQGAAILALGLLAFALIVVPFDLLTEEPNIDLNQLQIDELCWQAQSNEIQLRFNILHETNPWSQSQIRGALKSAGQKSQLIEFTRVNQRVTCQLQLAAGVNKLTIQVRNGGLEKTLNFQAELDRDVPIIEPIRMIKETFDSSLSFNLQSIASDKTKADEVVVSVSDEQGQILSQNRNWSTAHKISLPIKPGSQKLRIQAKDRSGNIWRSNEHTITRHPSFIVGTAKIDSSAKIQRFADLKSATEALNLQARNNELTRARIYLSPGKYSATTIDSELEYLAIVGLGNHEVVFEENNQEALSIQGNSNQNSNRRVEIENLKFTGYSIGDRQKLGRNKFDNHLSVEGFAPGPSALKISSANSFVKNCQFTGRYSIAITVAGSPIILKKPKYQKAVLIESCEFRTGRFATMFSHSYANITVRNCQFLKSECKTTDKALSFVHFSKARLEDIKLLGMRCAGIWVTNGAKASGEKITIHNASQNSISVAGILSSFAGKDIDIDTLDAKRLEGIFIDHTRGAVVVESRAKAYFENLRVKNSASSGIYLDEMTSIDLIDSEISHNKLCGLFIQPRLEGQRQNFDREEFTAARLKNVKIHSHKKTAAFFASGKIKHSEDCQIEFGTPESYQSEKQLKEQSKVLFSPLKRQRLLKTFERVKGKYKSGFVELDVEIPKPEPLAIKQFQKMPEAVLLLAKASNSEGQ